MKVTEEFAESERIKFVELAFRSAAYQDIRVTCANIWVDTEENMALSEDSREREWVVEMHMPDGIRKEFHARTQLEAKEQAAKFCWFTPQSFRAAMRRILDSKDRSMFERYTARKNLIKQALREREEGFLDAINMGAMLDREVELYIAKLFDLDDHFDRLRSKGPLEKEE